MKKQYKKKWFFLIIILLLVIFIGGWKIKYYLARKAADSYLKEKYNIEMIYKTMRFVITDPSGYYITYTSAENDGFNFTVFVYSSLYHSGHIEDNYYLEWLNWSLQEQMNTQFSKQLESTGENSKICVYLNYYENDKINDNLSIFEIQKEIPYYIIIYTDCKNDAKLNELCDEIKTQGYKPEKIKFKALNY